MSLFGALNTATSGLSSQSASFGNISDNIANSQTTGYKQVDTSFQDFLTTSTATTNDSGAVQAAPLYQNNVQGTVVQSSDPLAMAIAGQGFFPVSLQTGATNGVPSFSPQSYYTRAGDFQMNAQGYLVNSAGQYLNGWSADAAGNISQTSLSPILVSQSEFNPIATTQVAVSANLPATPAAGTPISSQVQIYDSLGNLHDVNLNWTQTSTNNWSVNVNVPDNTSGASVGTANLQFGPSSGNPVPAGTIGSVTGATGTLTAASYTSGQPATLSFTANFGNGAQTVQLNLGTYGQSNGVTQYAGTTYSVGGLTQNGMAAGSFQNVTTDTNGNITVNYNNGQSRVIAQIPVVTFAAPDALQRQNSQAFTATQESGAALAQVANSNGAGSLVTGSVETSNVDIASEFSKMIVAQEAYSANAKMITTTSQLLQTTINMVQ